jgi:hypothetical protein
MEQVDRVTGDGLSVTTYRHGPYIVRVTVRRNDDAAQSAAVAEVLTSDPAWTEIAREPPENWFPQRVSLDQVAAGLRDRAAAVLPLPGTALTAPRSPRAGAPGAGGPFDVVPAALDAYLRRRADTADGKTVLGWPDEFTWLTPDWSPATEGSITDVEALLDEAANCGAVTGPRHLRIGVSGLNGTTGNSEYYAWRVDRRDNRGPSLIEPRWNDGLGLGGERTGPDAARLVIAEAVTAANAMYRAAPALFLPRLALAAGAARWNGRSRRRLHRQGLSGPGLQDRGREP